MNNLATGEPCLLAPLAELGAGKVKRIAKFDQHVQRHDETEGVLPALIVDYVLDGDQRAADWQRAVSLGDQHLLVLEIPVVKNHSHRDDVRFGKLVREKVDGLSDDPAAKITLLQPPFRDRLHNGKIARPALHMR